MKSVERKFVEMVRRSLRESGLRLVLRKVPMIDLEGFHCRGYFCDTEICIAIDSSRWIEVLAHEFAHFIQWKTGSILYRKCFGPTNDYADVVDAWIGGDESYDRRRVRRAFDTYRAMERECERLAVKVLKENGIPFDLERYTQEANCYIYMYHFMEHRRIKSFSKSPFSIRTLRMMPSSFRAQSHRTMPKGVKEVLEDLV